MSDQQFEIDVPAVLNLAQDYHAEAQGLTSDAMAFGSDAARIGQAFGLLGICDGAAEQYAGLLTSALKALGIAAETLDAEAEQLGRTTQIYMENEERTRQQFGRVHQSF